MNHSRPEKTSHEPKEGTRIKLNPGEKVFLDVLDLSLLFKVTEDSIRKMLKAGRIKSNKIGRRYFVTLESLEEYLNCSEKEHVEHQKSTGDR